MSSVCIIGAGGVGKAHALAAVKVLSTWVEDRVRKHIYLVDSDERVAEKYSTRVWSNSWGPINDEIIVPNGITWSFHHPDELNQIEANLFIIATPSEWHRHYLLRLSNRPGQAILCEKPLLDELDDPHERLAILNIFENIDLHIGIEWMYHPDWWHQTIEEMHKIKTIEFCHAWAPAYTRDRSQVFDLGSHCLGLLLDAYGANTQYRIDSVTHTGNVTDVFITPVNHNQVHLRFGYDPKINPNEDCVKINGKKMNWIPFSQGDLFYLQLCYIMGVNEGDEFSYPMFTKGDLMKMDNVLREIHES